MPTLQFEIPERNHFDEANRAAVTSVDGSIAATVSFAHAGATINVPQFNAGQMKNVASEMPTVFTLAFAGDNYVSAVVTAKFGDTVDVTMVPKIKIPEIKIPEIKIPGT